MIAESLLKFYILFMFTSYILSAIMLVLERHTIKRNDVIFCIIVPSIPLVNTLLTVFLLGEILMYRINIKGKYSK